MPRPYVKEMYLLTLKHPSKGQNLLEVFTGARLLPYKCWPLQAPFLHSPSAVLQPFVPRLHSLVALTHQTQQVCIVQVGDIP